VKLLVEVEGAGLGKVAVVEGEPFVVVVGVPAFNEERTIARVVLLAQNYVDKVLVCDDGSKETGRWLKEYIYQCRSSLMCM